MWVVELGVYCLVGWRLGEFLGCVVGWMGWDRQGFVFFFGGHFEFVGCG